MDIITEQNMLLQMLEHPAFLARDGKIAEANAAAASCFLEPGKALAGLLRTGGEDLEGLHEGSLCLTLDLGTETRNAAARKMDDGSLLFLLDDPEEGEMFRALWLAAQQLRGPLSDAMNAAAAFQENLEEIPAQEQKELSALNRSLYRLLRQVGNMTEIGQLSSGTVSRKETTEVGAFFREIFEKACTLAKEAGKEVVFSVPSRQGFASLDRSRMERAAYNLVSNALRFTPKGGKIVLRLEEAGKRFLLSVQDNGDGLDRAVMANLFSRYRRTPGPEDQRNGLGLGLQLVRKTAAMHGGTLLVCPAEAGGTRAVLSFAKKAPGDASLSSPAFRLDYAGERDHALVELSGELPDDLYFDEI